MLRNRRFKNERTETGPPPAPAFRANWQPPPELQRSIPRPVELRLAGWALVVVIVLMAAGAIALGIGLNISRQRAQALRAMVEREGVGVEGRVVETGRTGSEDRARFIVYRYAARGREYEKRVVLGSRSRELAQVGAVVTARYLPGEPERSWMLGYEPNGPPLWAVFLAPVSMVAAAPLLARLLRTQARLLSTGRPAEAHVLGSRRVSTGKSTHYQVEYEYRILSGATRKVKVDASRRPPEPGATVTLIYDPDNPKKAIAYPLALVRVAT